MHLRASLRAERTRPEASLRAERTRPEASLRAERTRPEASLRAERTRPEASLRAERIAWIPRGSTRSMAEIVLGLGTSHTPMLTIPAELWPRYAEGDQRIPELAYPPTGQVRSYEQGLEYIPPEIKAKFQGSEPFADQWQRCQRALDTLASTLQSVEPDITIIISDDQDEWFSEHHMPRFAIYWGETVPLRKRRAVPGRDPEIGELIAKGYGDQDMDVPVPANFGRYLVEYLSDHDFDVAHFNQLRQPYGV